MSLWMSKGWKTEQVA